MNRTVAAAIETRGAASTEAADKVLLKRGRARTGAAQSAAELRLLGRLMETVHVRPVEQGTLFRFVILDLALCTGGQSAARYPRGADVS